MIEVAFSNREGQKRRVIFSGSQHYQYSKDNIARHPTHVRVPIGQVLEGVWLNLQLNIQSFVELCFGRDAFNSIDSITVQGACLLRKVFTSKCQIPDSFPFVLEQEFGSAAAAGFEEYIATVN